MQALNIARLLAAWFILYLATGYISLFLDDPVSRVSYVWFPAGVAVSAFLLTGRSYWPALFLTLFAARLLLDVTLRHSLETSLLHAAISLCNDIAIAYCVIRFGRPNDRLHRMLIWLIATFSLSALAAVPGAGWLVLRQGLDFSQTFGIWWSANVIGVILFTTIVMGLIWKPEPASVTQKGLAVVLWLLLCVSTWFVFHQSVDNPRGAALLFGFACLPVTLMILIPVLTGSRVGAFSLLCFSSIVIYYSWQQTGPFFRFISD
ncbi:MASE1 domain-containing protein [Photobacterium sp. 2_MG-2023]|nr:MASE1 domain-containing protein [Photobacterium sp. 2_MG-2023]